MLRDFSVEEVVEFALACERQFLAQSGHEGTSGFQVWLWHGAGRYPNQHKLAEVVERRLVAILAADVAG